jgi:AcrR family transcriptional regulator
MEPVPSPFRSTRTNDEERRQKRAALLLAAARMFNEKGFYATSLDDVAASLGVTKPVIYHHLGNKEQVLFECMNIALEKLLEAAREIDGKPGSGLDRLKMFLKNYAEVIMGDFGRCVIRTGDVAVSESTRRKIRESKRQVDEGFRRRLREPSRMARRG